MKGKGKKALKIILIIFLTIILLIGILCFWDPTGFLGVRPIGRMRGTYYVQDEKIEQEAPFTVEYISKDMHSINIVIKANDEEINYYIDTFLVCGKLIRFSFQYGDDGWYQISCTRSSTQFKLVGERTCNLLKCNLSYNYTQGSSTIYNKIETFKAVLK
jgi:hypothetical protein